MAADSSSELNVLHIVLLSSQSSRCWHSTLPAIESKRNATYTISIKLETPCLCAAADDDDDSEPDWRSNKLTTVEDAMQSCHRRLGCCCCCKWIQFLFVCAQKSNWIFDLDWHRFSVWVQWNAFICHVCRCNVAAALAIALSVFRQSCTL